MKPQIQSFLTAMALSALVLFCRSGAFAQSIHDTLWQTDGAVLSTARFGDTLFVGGGFKHVGPYTGCGGMLDTSTGEVLPGYYNSRLKMQISSVIPDGSGGWYVGGSNSMYQEAEHTVRHLLADNTIDPVFDPNPRLAYPSFSAASIYCLASYGENIYFGGDVATVSMQGRSKMAAVNKITGALTSWNPPTINSYVRAIAFSGSNVIIGGDFTQIGGQVRNRLAAIDINTGALTSWNPNANGAVYTILISGSTIYVGGSFTKIGDSTRNRIASFDATTGLLTAWKPSFNNYVYAITISGSSIYVGGSFTTVGTSTRQGIAQFDLATGDLDSWSPRATGVRTIAVSDSKVYIGGSFWYINDSLRDELGVIDSVTGRTLSWKPCAPRGYVVNSMAFSGPVLYVGGDFPNLGWRRENLAAINLQTGKFLDWAPNLDGSVITMSVLDSTLFIGGSFDSVDGQRRRRLASFSLKTGNVSNWIMDANNTVRAIASSGIDIFVGGEFTKINDITKPYLVSFYSTGSMKPSTVLPNASVYAIAISGGNVYIGGNFTQIGGDTRMGLAAINLAGSGLLPWNPTLTWPSGYQAVKAIAVSDTTVYVGGYFDKVGDSTRVRLAAISTNLVGRATIWNPGLSTYVSGSTTAFSYVNAVSVDGPIIYVAGNFSIVSAQKGYCVAIDAISGIPTDWCPIWGTPDVRAIYVVDPWVYLGGQLSQCEPYASLCNPDRHNFLAYKRADYLYTLTTSATNGTITKNPNRPNYDLGTLVQLTTIPNTGHHFMRWSGDVPSGHEYDNPLTIIIDQNKTIASRCDIDTFYITATAIGRGTISPSGIVPVIFRYYRSFTITPNPDGINDSVFVDGYYIGKVTNYTFTSVTRNHTIVAYFRARKDTITASAVNGTINPAGTVPVDRGSDKRFTWAPNTNYHFSDLLVDGVHKDSTTSYTFTNIAGNHTIQANFTINTYTIIASKIGEGAISPSGTVNVNHGSNKSFSITPLVGHHIDSVKVDGVNVGTVTTYQFTNVTTTHTITAYFSIHKYTITASAVGDGTITPSGSIIVNYGSNQSFSIVPNEHCHVDSVKVNGVNLGVLTSYEFTNVSANYTITAYFALDHFTITSSKIGEGTITPSGSVVVNYGNNQSLTITPLTGHHADSIKVDGANVGAVTTYQFTNVTTDHTITAYFSINKYTITASVIGNGTIAPSGTVSVNHGSNQSFTLTPSTGYHTDSVKVDSINIGVFTTYQFTNVITNHTIAAYFSINKYTITASAVGNGTITPVGSIIKNHGDNQSFSIVPDVNHHTDSVKIDGVNQGAITNYQFNNITGNHSITSYFSINRYVLNLTKVGNGEVSKIPNQPTYTHGSTVQISCTPASHYIFTGWSGDIPSGQEMTNPIAITMNSEKNITASFVLHFCEVTSPDGGENLYCGAIWPITWNCANVGNIKIEYSTNNGSSWQEIIASTPASSGNYDWTVPTGISTGDALVRITDVLNASMYDESDDVFTIGMSWLPQTVGTDKSLTDVCFINTTTGWAVGNNGVILYTSNGGTNWIDRMNGAPSLRLAGVSFVNDNYGWVACENGKILRTTNGGLNWSVQTTTTSNHLNDIYFMDETRGWVVGNGGVVLSTINGGLAWTRQTGPISEHLTGISFIDEDLGWVIGANGTIMHTINGGDLWSLQSGGTTDQLNDICFIDEEYGWIVGNNGTIISTTNGGSTWTVEYSGTTRHLNGVCFISDDFGWVVGNNGTILRYGGGALRNAVQTQGSLLGWEGVPSGTTRDLSVVFFIGGTMGTIMGDSGTVLNYNPSTTDSSYLPLSISATQSWNMLSIPMVITDFKATVAFKGCNSDIFAYNPLTGYESQNVLKNGAGYWARFPNSKCINICGVQINLDTFDVIEGWNMIGSIGMLIPVATIISEPGGLITSNFFGYDGSYIVVDNIMPGKGYWVKASEAGKLILSSGSILSASARIKIQPTSGLPPPPPGEGYVLSETIPQEYKLEQAYPNPFNPTTKIRYDLPKTSKVALKIYNLLGQEVETLVNEEQDAGYKSVEWDASYYPSGVYFYKLTADANGKSFVDVKKVVLLR